MHHDASHAEALRHLLNQPAQRLNAAHLKFSACEILFHQAHLSSQR
jgi:hypothetical protein